MSSEIRADYSQMYLLPPSLEEWIPGNHPARFVRDFVESLDLKKLEFKESANDDGRPAYSSDLLLKVWVYGYYKKIKSSRSLEQACYDNIGMIWLTGRHYPDHNTLWRFWRDNKHALRSIFREVVFVGLRSGAIGFELHAVDGSKITADASNLRAWHLKELRAALHKIESGIEDYVCDVESSESGISNETRLPEKLSNRDKRVAAIRDAIAELESLGLEHMNPADRDARLMKNGVGVAFSYNAQVAVDSNSGLVVAEKVVNEGSDYSMLSPMLEETAKNLGNAAGETVFDGGYYSSEQLARAEEKGYGVLVPIKERVMPSEKGKGCRPLHKSRFVYNVQSDVYLCPEGAELRFESEQEHKDRNYAVRRYRCKRYKQCEHSIKCNGGRQGRVIERGPYDDAVIRQWDKQRLPSKMELLKKRGRIIERVFGQIKHNDSMRRFTVRGLANVSTQWSLVCAVFNLKKLYGRWLVGRLALA